MLLRHCQLSLQAPTNLASGAPYCTVLAIVRYAYLQTDSYVLETAYFYVST